MGPAPSVWHEASRARGCEREAACAEDRDHDHGRTHEPGRSLSTLLRLVVRDGGRLAPCAPRGRHAEGRDLGLAAVRGQGPVRPLRGRATARLDSRKRDRHSDLRIPELEGSTKVCDVSGDPAPPTSSPGTKSSWSSRGSAPRFTAGRTMSTGSLETRRRTSRGSPGDRGRAPGHLAAAARAHVPSSRARHAALEGGSTVKIDDGRTPSPTRLVMATLLPLQLTACASVATVTLDQAIKELAPDYRARTPASGAASLDAVCSGTSPRPTPASTVIRAPRRRAGPWWRCATATCSTAGSSADFGGAPVAPAAGASSERSASVTLTDLGASRLGGLPERERGVHRPVRRRAGRPT